jgi:hypothetical protein
MEKMEGCFERKANYCFGHDSEFLHCSSLQAFDFTDIKMEKFINFDITMDTVDSYTVACFSLLGVTNYS